MRNYILASVLVGSAFIVVPVAWSAERSVPHSSTSPARPSLDGTYDLALRTDVKPPRGALRPSAQQKIDRTQQGRAVGQGCGSSCAPIVTPDTVMKNGKPANPTFAPEKVFTISPVLPH